VIGALLRQFGPVSGGGTPPAAPVLSVNSDGTVVTVAGSDSDTTNDVYARRINAGYGSSPWVLAGSRFADGTVALALDPGAYWLYDLSSNSGGAAISNVAYALVGTDQTGDVDHSPADILRWLLVALNVGVSPAAYEADTTLEWPIYNDTEPATPDNVITTYDTTAGDDGRSMVTGLTYQHYGVQVRVRSALVGGWPKIKRIQTVLDQQVLDSMVTIGSSVYLVHSVDTANPLRLGKEVPNSARRLFTLNCLVSVMQLQ
jgi:hypothetical protein